ncbi:DUF805 domain-containing protein [Salisediminibacterium halotolerans]|uniref:Uncharacterized membrane protein YhaH, DUF805 family n=1 Tax=Salisediminibacterium halotolerans TaxID=517425 RepID=A0A1H9T8Z0_9BACI|nr:DUF805 domain-containing protein [Salisediminibacterium haloalkalitolerans]SER93414.1 Uncharacterized membrane protein YhaH, DUF805 family [Salisediminibacterium haloalkalitolerans]
MNWYIHVLRNFSNFHSRARRTEYWMFVLINFLILLVLNVIESALDLPTVLSSLYSLIVFLPSLAVAVRRLHDTGRSGWWILINLVPFIGQIVFLIFVIIDSEQQENRWGPVPK